MPHIHELYDFTASAFILHPTENKLCLHLHRKLNAWLQFGGHIELDEDPMQALAREIKEEAGLSPDQYVFVTNANQPRPRGEKTITMPMHLGVHPFSDNHQHIDFTYLLRAKTEMLVPSEGESTQIGWFDREEIRDLHAKGLVFDNIIDICEWIFDTNS